MFKAIAAFAAVSAMVLGTAGAASAACNDGNDRWVKVVNNSSRTVYSVHATNTGNTDWGPNIAAYEIPAHYNLDVNMDDGSCRCLMDLRAEASNRRTVWEKFRFNVCVESEWHLGN